MAQTLTASHYYNHDPAIPPGDSRWYLVVDLVDDSGFTGEETINIHLTGDVNDPTATGTMQVNGGVGQYTFPRVASGLYDIWTLDASTAHTVPENSEVPGEWVSAWRPIEVEIEFGEEVGELPALVEGQLYAAFGQSDLELIATPFAFVGPEGVATFDLAPWLQRMKINAPGFGLNYHLFQRYRFVVPGHYTGPISYCLNSTLPHTALAPNPNMALSPFGNRVPFWPGFMACATYLTETYAQTAVFSAIQTAGATPVQEGITFVEQPCPDYPLQLVWFDPVGGWATWVFGLAASFETEVSDGSTFTTPGRVKHYADRGQVVSRVSVSSGPIADRSLLEGLRQIRRAVQCYQYKNGSFIPVMIEGGTFADGRANDRRQSVSLTFRYAEALISQRQ